MAGIPHPAPNALAGVSLEKLPQNVEAFVEEKELPDDLLPILQRGAIREPSLIGILHVHMLMRHLTGQWQGVPSTMPTLKGSPTMRRSPSETNATAHGGATRGRSTGPFFSARWRLSLSESMHQSTCVRTRRVTTGDGTKRARMVPASTK